GTAERRQHMSSRELAARAEPLRVRVDDAWCSVRQAADDALLVRTAGEDGPQHTVLLSPGPRPSHAAVGGEVLAVEVESDREAALAAALASAGGRGGSGTIK